MDAYSGVPSPRLLSIVRQIHSELGRFVESVKPIIWPDDDKADIPFDLMFSVDENDVKELTGYLIQHGPYPFANRVVAEWDALHNRVIAYSVIATRDWDDYAKALAECQRLGVVAPASPAEVGKCLRALYLRCQVDAWQFQKTIGYLSEALPGIVGAEHDAGSREETTPLGNLGFLGTAELADALRVHKTRRDAFIRQLERNRLGLENGDWQEVSEPQPNSPRFLYRADSPRIQALAKPYQSPKSA